jgi:ketosteroid isomerase-like protein
MAHRNQELIGRFYRAFAARDPDGMGACYAPGVRFSDPAFPDLRGDEARAMWRMLCTRGKDLRVEHTDVVADDSQGTAHWQAWYTFSQTGRAVHNVIAARFRFEDGLIVEHIDDFDFHRWARHALGPAGLFLGWTGFLRRKVQHEAAKGLAAFRAGSRPVG